jgi:hypothetical protein
MTGVEAGLVLVPLARAAKVVLATGLVGAQARVEKVLATGRVGAQARVVKAVLGTGQMAVLATTGRAMALMEARVIGLMITTCGLAEAPEKAAREVTEALARAARKVTEDGTVLERAPRVVAAPGTRLMPAGEPATADTPEEVSTLLHFIKDMIICHPSFSNKYLLDQFLIF